MRIILLLSTLLLLASPSQAEATCSSAHDTTPRHYWSHPDGRYTICYQVEADLPMILRWVDYAFSVGAHKYGVTTPTVPLTLFFPAEPTTYTNHGQVTTITSQGRGAEIHYLTPSTWLSYYLDRPPEHYHAHYITHEVVNYFQWSYFDVEDVPNWIRDGMAEYDGYHTTDYNSTVGIDSLRQHMIDGGGAGVVCCADLNGRMTLSASDEYHEGGFLMYHLAHRYGEAIHLELLEDDLQTVLGRHGSSIPLFYWYLRQFLLGETQ